MTDGRHSVDSFEAVERALRKPGVPVGVFARMVCCDWVILSLKYSPSKSLAITREREENPVRAINGFQDSRKDKGESVYNPDGHLGKLICRI